MALTRSRNGMNTNLGQKRFTFTVIMVLNVCFILWTQSKMLNDPNSHEILDEVNSLATLTSSPVSSSSPSSSPPPPNCTRDQLLMVRSQLNPLECIDTSPWMQRCSLTKKTKCPDTSNWLDEYYEELQT
jgi:hypothetical protein